MKRKSLLFVMASVCLFSCQQQEELQDPSKGVIDFSTSIDQSINNALTRNSSSLTLPLKAISLPEMSSPCPLPSRIIIRLP